MSRRTPILWPALAASLALFLVVTVSLRFEGAETAATVDAGEPATVAEGGPAALAIDLTEWEISGDLTAPAGQPLAISVHNSGTIPHDLAIAEVGAATPEIAGGGDATLDVEALDAGEYKLLCQVPGHEAAGMSATLTVAEGAVATPAADTDADGHGEHAGVGAMTMTPEEMVEHHNEGIANFLDGYGGEVYGNNLLEPEIDEDGAKVFKLTADEIEWETKPGVTKTGLAYNGQIPGPMIRAELGERIKIELTNNTEVPTAIHTHGLVLPNAQDGVPGITQDAVMPGESFTYDITLKNAGSHMYHSHFDAAWQVPAGLLGALIVDDPERPVEEDIDYTMVLNDGPLGFTLNGKDFPATEPIVAEKGQKVRVRFMNEGLQIHPMHLHGMHMTVIEKDGYPLPQPYKLDTLNIAPGERIDVVVEAEEPGAWAFHCHILNHAEGADGMFGMVTALVITE